MTDADRAIRVDWNNLRETQVKFLTTIGNLEKRTEDGKRLIEIDENYLNEIVAEAKGLNYSIMAYRKRCLVDLEQGIKGHNSKELKEACLYKCSTDIIYWIDMFAWIRNPHLTRYGFPVNLPFVLYPKQVDYIKWKEDLYKKGKNGLVYKCRDVGVSWLNVVHQAWHWLFEEGFQGRFGSLKAEEVDDKNDPDSLLQKLRIIIYRTPYWMRPEAFRTQDNSYDTKMKIINPDNKATITGQQGDSMGRGGRAAIYDVDEWAKVEHDKMVDANLSANAACIIYTSTPIGGDNDYAEKYRKGLLPIFSFDYWDDPRKTSDWLANFSEKFSEEIVKQEVLKSFDAFKFGTAISTEWVAAAVTLYEKIRKGEIDYQGGKRAGGLDVAAGGRNRTAMVWRNGICLEEEYTWDMRNSQGIANRATTVADETGLESVGYDPISAGVGVRSAFEMMETAFRPIAVDYRAAASEYPLEGDTRPARDRCTNRRAELMERARIRFERTYEFIAKGVDHPIETLVALNPNCQQTISQLSIPERYANRGKVRLESKEDMMRRAIQSPDHFDAFMICWADEIEQKHVIRSFNPQDKFIVEKDEIPAKQLAIKPTYHNYISLYHAENYNAAAIGGLWDGANLLVYDELLVPNPSVRQVINLLNIKFPTGAVYQWIGNKAMFKKGQDDLFYQYLQAGIMFIENMLYNEQSAIALLNQMFDQKAIRISKHCMILLRQLDSFVRHRGEPDPTNMELAMALANLINRLDEMHLLPQPIAGYTDYGHQVIEGRRIPPARWQKRPANRAYR